MPSTLLRANNAKILLNLIKIKITRAKLQRETKEISFVMNRSKILYPLREEGLDTLKREVNYD